MFKTWRGWKKLLLQCNHLSRVTSETYSCTSLLTQKGYYNKKEDQHSELKKKYFILIHIHTYTLYIIYKFFSLVKRSGYCELEFSSINKKTKTQQGYCSFFVMVGTLPYSSTNIQYKQITTTTTINHSLSSNRD